VPANGGVPPSEPIVAFVVAVALFLVGRVVIRRTAESEQDPWLAKALTVCLLLHLAAAPGQIWVVDHIYGGTADFTGYVNQGEILGAGFRHLDFSLAPAHLHKIVADGSLSIVAGVFFAVIGANELAVFFVFAFVAFLGILFFYKAFVVTFGGAGKRRYGYLLFFLPTLVFWTSDVSKEAVMTFLLGVTAFGCARVLTNRRGGYPLIVAASVGGIFIRPNELVLALGGFVVAMLLRPVPPGSTFEGPRRTAALIFLGTMFGVAAFVSVKFLGSHGSLSLTTIAKNNGGHTGAGFASSLTGYSASPIDYPRDVYWVMFDPLPFNAHTKAQFITALENTVILVVILASWRRLRTLPRAILGRPYVGLCLAFTLAFFYFFAALSNEGLITRERSVMMPFFLVLLAVPVGPKGRPPRYEWELRRRARLARRRRLAAQARSSVARPGARPLTPAGR
jgi:hypothetical protein